MSTDTTTADSSTEYSDWMADHGFNLEPPKRSKRKPVKKRSVTPPSGSDRRRSSRRPKKKVSVSRNMRKKKINVSRKTARNTKKNVSRSKHGLNYIFDIFCSLAINILSKFFYRFCSTGDTNT